MLDINRLRERDMLKGLRKYSRMGFLFRPKQLCGIFLPNAGISSTLDGGYPYADRCTPDRYFGAQL